MYSRKNKFRTLFELTAYNGVFLNRNGAVTCLYRAVSFLISFKYFIKIPLIFFKDFIFCFNLEIPPPYQNFLSPARSEYFIMHPYNWIFISVIICVPHIFVR